MNQLPSSRKNQPNMEQFLTTAELASILRLAPRTVHDLANRGLISPVFRTSRRSRWLYSQVIQDLNKHHPPYGATPGDATTIGTNN